MNTLRTWRLAIVLAGGMSAAAYAENGGGAESKRPYTLALDALVGPSGTDVVLQVSSTGGQALPAEAEHVLLWSSTQGRVTGARFLHDVPLVAGKAVISGLTIPAHSGLSAVVTVKIAGRRKIQVLSASTVVLDRPDLRISYVSSPALVNISQTFNIDVVVQEARGYRGARFDVELLEGATVLDTVTGATIDAMGTATAVFTVRLDTASVHSLTARIVNTSPAEYDASNNSATFDIRVAVLVPTSYSLNYRRFEGEFSDNFDSSTSSSAEMAGRVEHRTQDQGSRYEEIGRHELLNYSSVHSRFVRGVIDFTATIRVDGREKIAYSVTGWIPRFSGSGEDWAQTIYQAYDPETDANVYVESIWTPERGGSTTITYSRSAGDYTFHSSGYDRFWSAVGVTDPSTGALVWTVETGETTNAESGAVDHGAFLDAYQAVRFHSLLFTEGAAIGGWSQEHAVTVTTVDRTWDETVSGPGQDMHSWGYERRTYWDATGSGVTAP